MLIKTNTPTIGRLIVLEGADGSGKTTLAHQLVSALNGKGIAVEYFSFPGKEPGTLGAEIYEIHHKSIARGISSLHPASLQVLHIAAHIDAIETKIIPALMRGTTIILDRYWWSTWVYGIVDGVPEISLKAMIEVETYHWSNIKPSAVFLITRTKGRPDDNVLERERRVTEYMRLAASERNDYPVRVIENEGKISSALRMIKNELASLGMYEMASRTTQDQIKFQELPPHSIGPQIFSKLAPAQPTIVYDTYWKFACERQKIFFARARGMPWPWSDDPILRDYKFTNAYRASDRVSQYLIKEVIYKGNKSPEEIFFRTLLFKIFNRIDTWEILRNEFGELSYKDYSFKQYNRILDAAMVRGQRIYSAAYIMPSGGAKQIGGRKHAMHLQLIDRMMKDELPKKMCGIRTMAGGFELLRSYPTIGDFLAYQYVTDINYGPHTTFSEMEFVVPGPGAFSGIHKCFSNLGGLSESEIIKVVTERQNEEFQRLGLSFQSLWGRALQLIDCQNLFCEVDKYARIKHPEFSGKSGRTRIKQKFSKNVMPLVYWFPPKWELNEFIAKERNYAQ